MKPTIRLEQSLKTKLSTTLRGWLPILQSSTLDLEDVLSDFIKENPYAEIKSGVSKSFSSGSFKNSKGFDNFDNFIQEKGLYSVLFEQISPPLFPTPISQEIAKNIVENMDENGFFDGDKEDIAQKVGCSVEEVEKVRLRFSYLDPCGVGAIDTREALIFQLDQSDLDGEKYDLALSILEDISSHYKYKNHPYYGDVINVIRHFNFLPTLEYKQRETCVIPDIFVFFSDGNIEINLNDSIYPKIEILPVSDDGIAKEDFSHIKTKLREARLLIDALEMRKATLKKIGLMIVEYQYSFFKGGEIRPMKLKDIAQELSHSASTISRAISNKYLECNRGVFPIKAFFTTALDDDVSNSVIKDFISDLVKNEDRKKPLSDSSILKLIEQKFGIKIVRRTITKYRQKLNIASSSERKKLYEISL